jgi:large subunit ribosomal protein L22
MEARAVLRYTRISPRKIEIILDLIRNKPVDIAMAILKNTPKAACEELEKLLASAIANAENNLNLDKNNLIVSECFVCPGPIMKRIRPRAQGRAFRILKRSSHVTIVLKENEEAKAEDKDVLESAEKKPAAKSSKKAEVKSETKTEAKAEKSVKKTAEKKSTAKKTETVKKKPAEKKTAAKDKPTTEKKKTVKKAESKTKETAEEKEV